MTRALNISSLRFLSLSVTDSFASAASSDALAWSYWFCTSRVSI